jgi:hypothetical protein
MKSTTVCVIGIAVGVGAAIAMLSSSRDEPAVETTTGALESKAAAPRGGPRRSSHQPGARTADPANYIAAEHTSDPARLNEFRAEADRAEDISPTQVNWQPTLIGMDLSDVAVETYIECSVHIRQPCRYDVDYVIEVKQPGIGQVVFGRLGMERAYSAECEQYAKCTIKGTVGATVPLPLEVRTSFARRKSQTDSNNPSQTAAELEAELEMFENEVERLQQEGPDGQPDWEYNLEALRSVITVIKLKLAAKTGEK